MQLEVPRQYPYSQLGSLRQLELNQSLDGVCEAMTYEWLKRQMVALPTNPAVLDRSLYHMASQQRAPIPRVGQVREAVLALEGKQSVRRFDRHISKLNFNSLGALREYASRDGLRVTDLNHADLRLDELEGDVARRHGWPAMTINMDKTFNEFSSDLRGLIRTLGGSLNLQVSRWTLDLTGGHAMAFSAKLHGARFFDPNAGEFIHKNPAYVFLWMHCNYIPSRYPAMKGGKLRVLTGTPRDAAALAAM